MNEKKEVVLTKEGLENLKKEYRHLIDVERPNVIEDLKNARAMGDLSENADYDAARNKQADVEGKIKEIEALLASAKVIDIKKNDKTAGIGKTIDLEVVGTEKKLVICIVSSEEADALSNPEKMKISNSSIVGNCLNGHKIGDIVTIKVAKPYDVKILDVKITD